MKVRVALALLGGLCAAARGEGKLVVEPAVLDEGRPVSLRVTWTHGGADAGLLLLEARAGEARAAREGPGRREALWLDALADEAVTLELEASEDVGAEARAPRPPVTAGLAGAPCLLLRQVVQGESLALELPLVPAAGAPLEVQLVARLAPFGPGGPLGGPRLYVPVGTWRWSPGEQAGADPLGGAPRGGGEPLLEVRLTRWRPRALGPSQEVLARQDEVEQVTPVEERLAATLQVRPAAFGLAAAAQRAGLRPAAAVRLADDRWLVQDATRSALVGPDGPVASAPGQLLPWALPLAQGGRARLTWYAAHERPALATALREAGLVEGEGKGLQVAVTAEALARFLALLEQHGVAVREGGIEAR